ncbi:MAG: D-aminoacylase [Rhodothermales bacterium]|nr:D-aminoacylase [Rhodothermales bacterium]
MKRREFIRKAATTSLLFTSPGIIVRNSYRPGGGTTLVIKGGIVISGDGSPGRELDVAIEGSRISAVARDINAQGAQIIDARGRIVCPGFIDIHSHTDLSLLINPYAESKLRQGVTTEVAGQDGGSIGPWTTDRALSVRQRYKQDYDIEFDFDDLRGFFHHLEHVHNPAVNFASMIGAGTVRAKVIGATDRPATGDELESMVRLVSDAIEAGACGLSTGLEYIPGAFASIDELVALCAPLKRMGLPYASHMRNEDNELLAAIEEAVTIGQRAGVPTHISHLKAQGQSNWWKAEAALEIIESVATAGHKITFDRYPYVAYSTGLSSLFPVWAREGGTDSFLERLDDPEAAALISTAVHAKVAQLGDWNSVQVTSTGSDSLAWARGRRLGELAAERNEDPYEMTIHLIRADRSNTGMVGFGMSEENTAAILSHPLGMICSDGGARATYGPLSSGTPHPRTYGTFPRVLGYYCRDKKVMTLERAVHKMTGMPANLLAFTDRGKVEVDFVADLVVFDPESVNDMATFENPHQYPRGIDHVLVNGRSVIRDGERTDERPGIVVRPTRRA